ncbi:hypothetical protein D3C81_2132590 [compost metagenome]
MLGIPHTPNDPPIEGSRIEMSSIVGGNDVGGVTTFTLPRDKLSFPVAVCHADVIWTATNSHGPANNIETTVLIDSRGTDKTVKTVKTVNSEGDKENKE